MSLCEMEEKYHSVQLYLDGMARRHKKDTQTMTFIALGHEDCPLDGTHEHWQIVESRTDQCSCNTGTLYQCAHDRPDASSSNLAGLCIDCVPNGTALCACLCSSCTAAKEKRIISGEIIRGITCYRLLRDSEARRLEDLRTLEWQKETIRGLKLELRSQNMAYLADFRRVQGKEEIAKAIINDLEFLIEEG